jgi:hypothetical protein
VSSWLSTVGTVGGGFTPGDPAVVVPGGGSGSLYIWLRNEGTLQSASYNIAAATPGVIQFTGATTYNADIFAGVDIGDRWNEPVAHGTVAADGQSIAGLTGVNVTAFGLALATRALDTRWDVAANAALFAKIDYTAIAGPAGGMTNLILSEGMALIVEDSMSPPLTFGGGSITVEPTGGGPAINLLGNSMAITSGDGTPSMDDHTDFGQTYLGATLQRTFTIENPGTADLVLGAPTIPAGFSLVGLFPTTIGMGASDTFTVGIDTGSLGVKSGNVSFGTNVEGTQTFSFAITGEVVIPEPSTFALAGLAVFGLVGFIRRRG